MPLQSLISAFKNKEGVSYDSTFSQSLQTDTQALQEYIGYIEENQSHQDAMALSMEGASQKAVEQARKLEGVSASVLQSGNYVNDFAMKQKMTETSVIATDKSLQNCSSIINEYNSNCKNVGLTQDQFVNAVGNSNQVMGNYLAGLGGAPATMNGYAKALLGAKLQTIGLQAASMALNAVIGLGIGLAISLADKLIVTSKEAIHAGEDAANAIKTINDKYSNAKATVEENAEAFARLAKGVDLATLCTKWHTFDRNIASKHAKSDQSR